MSGWVTQADRAGWQRQAALALAAILSESGGDLPALTWAVIPAGPLLEARLVPAAHPAAHVREVLAAWRAALGLDEYREWNGGGGTTRLHAAGRRDGVRVRIFASVFEEDR